jgi:hypothetical protein
MEQTAPKYQSICEALLNERPIISPARPPEIDQAYAMIASKRLNEDDTLKAKSKVFIEFKSFFDEKYKAESHNFNNFMYIYDLLKSEQDKQTLEAYYKKLDEFKRVIMTTIKPYPVMRIDFNRFKYPTKINNINEVAAYTEIEWKE